MQKWLNQARCHFGLWTWFGPRNQFRWVQIPHGKGHFQGGKRQPIVKYMDYRLCAAMMQPFCKCFDAVGWVAGRVSVVMGYWHGYASGARCK